MTLSDAPNRRRDLIVKAVEDWCKQLVDLTGNNRLIYYRRLKSGTLDLAKAKPETLRLLSSGNKVKLSELFDIESDDYADVVKRTRSIAAKGRSNFEERGISTLFLASYLATWDAGDTSTSTPNAPVLLAPLAVKALGGGMNSFEFERVGSWEVNETLLLFWKERFGFEINRITLDALIEESGEDQAALIAGLGKLVMVKKALTNYSVSDALLCGNFSYTKLPMVRDIQDNIDALATNEIIAAIAGDESAQESVRDSNASDDISLSLPDQMQPEDEFLILDADSSQSHVINSVIAGRSTIIQGPPGTGKSQTIANLIASISARGQSVLFVAEKRAAIEAVSKRLEMTGLGNLALDLHTSVLNKKDTAVALASSLEDMAATVSGQHASNQRKLVTSRQAVIDYDRELHEPRSPWGASSFEVNTQLLGFDPEGPIVRFDASTTLRFKDEHVADILDTLAKWVGTRLQLDWASGWINAPIADTNAASGLVDLILKIEDSSLPRAELALASLAVEVGCDLDDRPISEVGQICELALEVETLAKTFDVGIWGVDTAAAAEAIANRRLFGAAGKEFRTNRSLIRTHEVQKLSRSDRLEAIGRVNDCVGRWRLLSLPGTPKSLPWANEMIGAQESLIVELSAMGKGMPDGLHERTLDEPAGLISELGKTTQTAFLCGQLQDFRGQLVELGCEPILDLVESGEVSEEDAEEVFAHSALRAIRSQIDDRNPVLNIFRSEDQNQVVQKFAAGDRWHLESGQSRVMRSVAENAMEARNAHPGQGAIIEREAKKRSRHRTLRQLQGDAGDVLTALRPCWMMSPLMVAQTLPPRPIFDYVIFDEASQIRPSEAVSAILRGKHLVVAGDSHQLPPSAFFTVESDDSEDDEEDQIDALTAGYESILDVMGTLLPARMLTWHYRSQDDRLIRLSNEEIYGGSLTTFPGSLKASPITFHQVSHQPTDPSEVRSNTTEVAKVVELMLDHAVNRPSESLGVIAFGQHHASAIEDHLRHELERMLSAELDAFFSEEQIERVFVKNIERVQGDERDAIILTIGYGKNSSGMVPHRFGPVNREGGERRINVAASRSRVRMMIVSSIGPGDLRTESLGKGPQLLEKLLRFAETGGEDLGLEKAKHPLNPFELAVKTELERVGLNPICQYGVGSYRIDFVLPHPSNDGRMVLAVEADGATYHSSPTARDRDRLRQEMLERLGWKFCRIWSTAFFRNPRAEAERVRAAYMSVLAGSNPSPSPEEDEYITAPQNPRVVKRPYLVDGVPIAEHDHRKLVALVRWITKDGQSLMTDDQIKERMKAELAYGRRGKKIEEAFDKAINGAR